MKMGFSKSFEEEESRNIERYEKSDFGGLPGVHRFPCSKETVDAFAEIYKEDYRTLGLVFLYIIFFVNFSCDVSFFGPF